MFAGACMWSVHVHELPCLKVEFAVTGSRLFCMWMSVVRTKICKYLFLYVPLFLCFIFSLITSCLERGSGMHFVIRPARACLRLLCMGSHLISTPPLKVVSVRGGRGWAPRLPLPNSFGGHSRRNCAVLVFAGQWGCTATEPVGQA